MEWRRNDESKRVCAFVLKRDRSGRKGASTLVMSAVRQTDHLGLMSSEPR